MPFREGDLGRAVAGFRTQGLESARLLVDTPRMVLVPAEVADDTRRYLDFRGFDVGPGDEVVIVQLALGPVAAMVVDGGVLCLFREKFGALLHVTSAFDAARPDPSRPGEAVFYLTGEHLYVTVWDGGALRYAEVLPYACAADLAYYGREIAAMFSPTGVMIKGLGARAAARVLRSVFKRVRCA